MSRIAMGRCLLYIAMSLDGFIARPNDDVSWLDPFNAEGEDYGYAEFMRTIGAAIMGARTYAQSLLHPERLLPELKTYVLSHLPVAQPPIGTVETFSGDPTELLSRIRRETAQDIYLIGGGQVVSDFLNRGLIDKIFLFIAPVLLGKGLPLFFGVEPDRFLKTVETRLYPSGIVKIHYRQ